MTRSIADIVPTVGHGYSLGAANAASPWFDAGDEAGIAILTLQFDGSWSGTLSFETAVRVNGAIISNDPVTATNMNGVGTATSTTGGTSTIEHWRVDLAGGAAVAAEITSYSAGTVTVTTHVTRG